MSDSSCLLSHQVSLATNNWSITMHSTPELEHNTNTFGCQDAGISYGNLQLKVDVVAQLLYAFMCVVNSSFLVGGEISYRSIGKSIKFCVHQYLVAYSLIGKLLFFLEVHIFGYWLGNNYIPKLAEQY